MFTNTLSLLSEDVLGTCGTDDDRGFHGCGAYSDSGVSVVSVGGEFTGEELVELRVEASVGDKFALG